MQGPGPSPLDPDGVLVQHRVPRFSDEWLVGDVPAPEAAWHDRTLELLKAVLEHWISRTQRDAAVFRNLAVRVRAHRPNVGFDPDLLVVEPAPPGATELSCLRLWEPGHAIPSFVVEVVSPNHPYKDYVEVPDRCAALGVAELVVFDPTLAGPKARGGPRRIQLWRRTGGGTFERVASGDGPIPSAFFGAYLVTVDGGRRLRIADDEAGERLWPTAEERASQRVAELERELAKRGRP